MAKLFYAQIIAQYEGKGTARTFLLHVSQGKPKLHIGKGG